LSVTRRRWPHRHKDITGCFVLLARLGPLEKKQRQVPTKTYQDCIRDYDDTIPRKMDAYMADFLNAVALIFEKHKVKMAHDAQEYRSDRIHEEEKYW
jgi:hypothetical protein